MSNLYLLALETWKLVYIGSQGYPDLKKTILSGRELTRRLHDGGPEEVHRGHEEGLLEEAGQSAAEAVLEAPSHRIFYHYQQKVRHDYHGFHWSQHGEFVRGVI